MHFVITYNPEILHNELKHQLVSLVRARFSKATFALLRDRNPPVAIRFDRQDDGPLDEYMTFVERVVNTQWTTPRGDDWHEEDDHAHEGTGGHDARGIG